MHTFLYIVWFSIPLIFLLIWLWGVLERMSGRPAKGASADSLRQAIFVLLCVGVSVAIDTMFLQDFVDLIGSDWLPLGFFQVILLPVTLYVGALVLGPSRSILIQRAPHPTEAKKKRR